MLIIILLTFYKAKFHLKCLVRKINIFHNILTYKYCELYLILLNALQGPSLGT